MKKSMQWRNWIWVVVFPMFLWQCAGTGSQGARPLQEVASHNLAIDSTITADPAMEALISPYRNEVNTTMNVVIAHADVDLKKGKPEATLNNLVADLMLQKANEADTQKVDVAITNVGGLRIDIPKGPITLRKVYELMPFENELVVLEFTGLQMRELAKQIGSQHGECIAGMRIEVEGERLNKFSIQGGVVNPDQIYRVVTTDYLSSPGRDKMEILGQVPRKFLGVKLRDAILDGLKAFEAEGKPVSAKIDGRMVVVGSSRPQNQN